MRLPVYKQVMIWGGATLVLLLVLWKLGNAVMPFLLGAGIAYLLDPVADWLERKGLSRTLAVVVISLVMLMIVVISFLVVVPVLVSQTAALIETAPQMFEKLKGFLAARFPDILSPQSTAADALSQLGSTISERGGELITTVLGSVMGIVGVIALLVIAPVVAFYLLLDWDHMVARVDELLPREHAPTIRRIASEIDHVLSGFIRGQGVVILILGTFYAISLGVIGLPFGVAIGALAATLSFIPYVGVLVGGATAIGVALFSFWGQPLMIGAVVAVFAIGQIVEGNYLQPKIVGGHVGLHPVWLMLALSVFGTLFGFVGLLVAVPLAASLGVLVRFAAAQYKVSAIYTGTEAPPPPAVPQLVELVPRGTTERQRDIALVSREVRIAEIRREETINGDIGDPGIDDIGPHPDPEKPGPAKKDS
ncbi:AI-2E family transporter [Paracoccus sp. DMF-8]|uniref:AI-2E family transporter n=1 Tax=Paracoccus sp. DMF-8 TaxID=3019445 RepID=UPI0023E833E3|nr:AI-2E family transporter [Paracoccus sp. DMF-8]MDF3605889.1 AI-2E family transporter [Paracoccus sp. DMF-8]